MLESGCKMLWKVVQSKGELGRGLRGIEQGCSVPATVELRLRGSGTTASAVPASKRAHGPLKLAQKVGRVGV